MVSQQEKKPTNSLLYDSCSSTIAVSLQIIGGLFYNMLFRAVKVKASAHDCIVRYLSFVQGSSGFLISVACQKRRVTAWLCLFKGCAARSFLEQKELGIKWYLRMDWKCE